MRMQEGLKNITTISCRYVTSVTTMNDKILRMKKYKNKEAKPKYIQSPVEFAWFVWNMHATRL